MTDTACLRDYLGVSLGERNDGFGCSVVTMYQSPFGSLADNPIISFEQLPTIEGLLTNMDELAVVEFDPQAISDAVTAPKSNARIELLCLDFVPVS